MNHLLIILHQLSSTPILSILVYAMKGCLPAFLPLYITDLTICLSPQHNSSSSYTDRLEEYTRDDKKKERMQKRWDFRYEKLWEEYYKEALKEDKTNVDFEIRHAL